MGRVATKAEFRDRHRLGLLGNRAPYWASVAEARAAGHAAAVAVRYGGRDSSWMRYGVPLDAVDAYISACEAEGAARDLFYLTVQDLPGTRVFQGEVCRLDTGLYLNYSTRPEPLRVALEADGHHATGAVAAALLRHFLDGSSHDDLMDLLDLYPDACVEFTTCDRPVGNLDHRSTIFWEVRDY